ncbi:MAG: 4Fe-4S dicluster domain-containing protein [bacterium]|nr:4Fe-4S dicluster domain-containing protein [bacterium]
MNKNKESISRREFLEKSGYIAAGIGIGSALPNIFWLDDAIAGVPVSGGYLLVDTKKCQGCMTCMLACSLVNEGAENLSMSRIQVIQNPFAKFPQDITLAQCRQCVEPECVKACPEEALFIDKTQKNIRRINIKKCTGCKACIEACPYEPARPVWSSHDEKARICDLCAEAKFWNERGGPDGKQACIETCPMKAIQFTKGAPLQKGDQGYNVNLRKEGWKKLGYPID